MGPAFLLPIILIAFMDIQRDLKRVDEWLLDLAQSVPLLLEEDFHDRALGPDDISIEEELWNRNLFNNFADFNDVSWIYTLIEKEGRLFMTAPTVTEEEALERESWYFFEYKDPRPEFYSALKSGKTSYLNYRDQWGWYRTVILPLDSPGGRRYAVCIDLAIGSYLMILSRSAGLKSLILLMSFFYIILNIARMTSSNPSQKSLSRHVLLSRKDLQAVVDAQMEKEKVINLQLINALYAGQMGLYSFNVKTGKLDHVFNNLLPDALGYKHGEYKLDINWIKENLVDPDFLSLLNELWREVRIEEKSQATLDLRMKDKAGNWQWFRLHLTLQKGIGEKHNSMLILIQGIQDAKMREKDLLQQVQTDDLTGLYNRYYWEDYFKAIQTRNRRSDLPLVICYMDINGLKMVNDNLGHNAGDKLLRDFAWILNKTIRGSDIAVRLGGDEFLLICPQTYKLEFEELWNRIRQNTEDFNSSMDRDYTLSFSHGICLLKDLSDQQEITSLMDEADRKMYKEKREMKSGGFLVLRS